MDGDVVCNDLYTAAKCLLEQSFAILRVDCETHHALKDSWIAARVILSHAADVTPQEQDAMLEKYRIIRDGALLGYNRPSESKVLFRALSVGGEPDHCQPWPDDFDGGALKTSSSLLMRHLHNLLLDCFQEVKKQVHMDDDDSSKTSGHCQLPRKKRKIDTSGSDSIHHVHEQSFDSTHCPLDYFLYHNRSKGTNCSEHVDRGVLICISLTNVAGLEVASRKDDEWHCPENVYTGREGVSNLICILSGDQLKNAVEAGDEVMNSYPGLNACIHRVKNKLSGPRLSISYELRSSNIKKKKK